MKHEIQWIFYSKKKIRFYNKKAESKHNLAKLINGLWRVFYQTGEARINLLMAGLVTGLAMRFYDKNPYKPVDCGGSQVSTTKLTISNLPMYMPEADTGEALRKLNVDIGSRIMHKLAWDENGRLSRFKTGCHFVYIVRHEEPLPESFDFGIFKSKLYYKEQPKSSSSNMCCRCLEIEHRKTLYQWRCVNSISKCNIFDNQ